VKPVADESSKLQLLLDTLNIPSQVLMSFLGTVIGSTKFSVHLVSFISLNQFNPQLRTKALHPIHSWNSGSDDFLSLAVFYNHSELVEQLLTRYRPSPEKVRGLLNTIIIYSAEYQVKEIHDRSAATRREVIGEERSDSMGGNPTVKEILVTYLSLQ